MGSHRVFSPFTGILKALRRDRLCGDVSPLLAGPWLHDPYFGLTNLTESASETSFHRGRPFPELLVAVCRRPPVPESRPDEATNK